MGKWQKEGKILLAVSTYLDDPAPLPEAGLPCGLVHVDIRHDAFVVQVETPGMLWARSSQNYLFSLKNQQD